MQPDSHKFSIVSNIEKFLVGMRVGTLEFEKINEADHAKNKIALTRMFDIEDNLRNAYDSLIPNVHILNIDKLTNLILEHIRSQYNLYIKFYSKKDPTDKSDAFSNRIGVGGGVAPTDTEINDMLSFFEKAIKTQAKWTTLMRNSIYRKISAYHAKIHQPGNPIKLLNELSEKLFNYTNSQYLITDAEAIKLGYEFSQQLDTVFRKERTTKSGSSFSSSTNIIGFTDPDLGSTQDTFVFFGKSFTAMKAKINEVINSAVVPVLNEIITSTDIDYQKFVLQVSTGYIANFGHGMVISKENGKEINRFVNAPGFASSVYGVTKGRGKIAGLTPHDAALQYKEKSDLVSNSIELTREFDASFGILMSLGVTITFPEDYDINQARGRQDEGPAKSGLVSRLKTEEISLEERKLRQDKFEKELIQILIEKVFQRHPESGTASRSMLQFMSDSVISILLGRKPSTEKEKIVKKTSTPVKTRKRIKTNAKRIVFAAPQIVGPNGTTSFPIAPRLRTTGGRFTSLVSIQNLLNQNLHTQIQKNMGTGDRRDILNYRTGRFAESVKVEKMSQSREGMIIAFYSYMRNPYATFSIGGEQSRPTTRDPKLLISKSIREIGAAMVNNRMRAVLV